MRVLTVPSFSSPMSLIAPLKYLSIWEGAEGKVGNYIREEMRLLHASLLGLHRVNLAVTCPVS